MRICDIASRLVLYFLLIMLCLFILCLHCPGQVSSKNFYWSLFLKGKPQGNMGIKTKGTEFKRNMREYQLVLSIPGKSKVTYTFNLDSVPKQYYVLNDWKSSPQRANTTIKINSQVLTNFGFEFPNYNSQGFEISRLLRTGENTIDIELGAGSDELWLRGTILTEDASLVRNVELMPDLLPGYAKTFALTFLILGILYLVWFFFNRTLYKNMDVYSASFALIGIMITCVATAYSFLLVTRMIGVSVFFLVFTLILAIAAMLSVKKTEDSFKKSVTTDTGAIGGGEPSGGDFNF